MQQTPSTALSANVELARKRLALILTACRNPNEMECGKVMASNNSQKVNMSNLADCLKAIHPADITAGMQILAAFVEEEIKEYKPLYSLARDSHAFIAAGSRAAFSVTLNYYDVLIHAVADSLFSASEGYEGLDRAEMAQAAAALAVLERIAEALGTDELYSMAPPKEVWPHYAPEIQEALPMPHVIEFSYQSNGVAIRVGVQ